MGIPANRMKTRDGEPSLAAIRVLAAVGWVVAAGVLALVGWVLPDEGATAVSLRQAVALAVVFAAVPTALWITPAPRVMSVVGGGWFVAGVATMIGGNVLMLAGVAYGLVVLLIGARSPPPLQPRVVGVLIGVAAALTLAVFLALDTGTLTGIVTLFLALGVASSGIIVYRGGRGG